MPIKHSEEFDISVTYGEDAISQLKRDRVPLWPEMYEVLYTYACGTHDKINNEINILKRHEGRVDEDSLVHIYDKYLSCDRSILLTDEVGTKIGEEIRKILAAIKRAGENSDKYDTALKKIDTKFSEIKTPEQLHSVVKVLSDVTASIARSNSSLNDRLQQSASQIDSLHRELEKARNESNTDPLTGLSNRKKFDQMLRRELKNLRDTGTHLCLLMADIDHFKSFNDRYGHQTGDQVLRLVAHTIKVSIKGRDTAARYGGEEFGIILGGIAKEDASKVAEQIREAVMAKELLKRSTGENLGRVTISIGLTEAMPSDTPKSLIERADKALYVAKRTGRNRCVIAHETGEEALAHSA
jgi:diguanylate cyclase